MGSRRPDNPGISTGNRTAVETTKGRRTSLREDGDIYDFYSRGPIQYRLSFDEFRREWHKTYLVFDDHVIVVDHTGKQRPFALSERQRAVEYAKRLVEYRLSKPAPPSAGRRPRRR